jgi:diazepam-binding inhibitor (GABA receptor modulating acyl-CoA-binding protein)
MAEMEKGIMIKFEAAVKRAEEKWLVDKPDKVQLYALRMQATVGDMQGTQTPIYTLDSKEKLDAWKSLKGTSKGEAAEKYIIVANKVGMNWDVALSLFLAPAIFTFLLFFKRERCFSFLFCMLLPVILWPCLVPWVIVASFFSGADEVISAVARLILLVQMSFVLT